MAKNKDIQHCPKCNKDRSKSAFEGKARYCNTCKIQAIDTRKAKARERALKWKREHPTQSKSYNMKWQQDNPDRIHQYYLSWKEKYPEKYEVRVRNYNSNRGLKWLDKLLASEENISLQI